MTTAKLRTKATAAPSLNPDKFSLTLSSGQQLSLRHFSIVDDSPWLTSWVNQDYAHFWGMQGCDQQQVIEEYTQLSGHSQLLVAEIDSTPKALFELYNPNRDAVGQHYPVQPGDIGMHILLGPPQPAISGFGKQVFHGLIQFIFCHSHIERIVVEPDANNSAIHRLNAQAGFRYQRVLKLAHKHAYLAFLTRQRHQSLALKHTPRTRNSMNHSTDFLTTANWQHANRHLIAKAISEGCHERLFQPTTLGDDRYQIDFDAGHYRFSAERLALEHWLIEPDSIEKRSQDGTQALDAIAFIGEFQHVLGINDRQLPLYLEEIASTLRASAYKLSHGEREVDTLINADFQALEAAMSEGHPAFIANNGRIGFGQQDFNDFAPEAGSQFQVIWLAARREHCVISTSKTLSEAQLLQQELGQTQLGLFEQMLAERQLNASDYCFIPVHPWQWHNKIAMGFAADLASNDLVYLGIGEDHYQPQQSIRTLFNRNHPNRHYVKTALSILNMGFIRGLSADYMDATPAINDWIAALIEHDPVLHANGFSVLKEIAAVGYRRPQLQKWLPKGDAQHKMLSALWRESPIPKLEDTERLMTMAGLLHCGNDGRSLVVAMIQASGLPPKQWLERYLHAYLTPLLHCFYAHDLVFMPHGENLILVLENHTPKYCFMKDIAEECAVLNKDAVLAPSIARIAVDVPDELKALSIQTDIFDGFFRYLSALLHRQLDFHETEFWSSVADCILSYQASQPQLSEQFRRYDLFSDHFEHSCLNRLQLANNQQMVDLADPAGSLQFQGQLVNPIAAFGPKGEGNEAN
ncbi:GNAT family N-acetyltransferase [Ferrimonas aestuarii]|uniref:GNAT family N-acetyltransferase n=1 Tax=Ferrimonas aestuarii TaxID=2569539 RepID=A0A4U1BG42_9GAMM|nr:GNAT family N-acetyltransferase [Ferrimonas aestuarii]TKB50116.1 GNAT family N-acetyltransferase [Ferrimonas aestuarii]